MYVLGGFGRGGVSENPCDPCLYRLDLSSFDWSIVDTQGDIPPALYSHTLTTGRSSYHISQQHTKSPPCTALGGILASDGTRTLLFIYYSCES